VIHVLDAHGKPTALGSGVVIRRGIVVTNCHVADAGPQLVVSVQPDKKFAADLRYADRGRDLCELAVSRLPAPSAVFGNSQTLQVGQTVYAIGAPEGLELTLSQGLISALRVVDDLRYVQTTASISPGSSGGGLFDAAGRLIGITTFQLKEGQNLNFALPVNWIAHLPERATKEQAQLEGIIEAGVAAEKKWVDRAAAFEEKSDWQGLLELAQNWTAQQADDEFAWFFVGEAYDGLNQYAEAVNALQKAIRLRSDDEDAWRLLSRDYLLLSKVDEASDAARHAIRLKPDDSAAWLLLALTYHVLGQRAEFVEAYQKLSQIDPKRAASLLNMVRASAPGSADEHQVNAHCAAGQHWVATSCGGEVTAQSIVPAQAAMPSAVVWGEDPPSGAVSSRLQDSLTGHTIRKVDTDFAEVSSQVSYSETRAGWEAYSVFAVATIKVTNTSDSPIQVEGTTQTLASTPEKFFLKSQIGCPYFAYWDTPRKKGTEPLPAEAKGTIALHSSQEFSVLMWIHISGSDVPDNAPDASNYISAPVPARYSIRVNGVDFVFPAKILQPNTRATIRAGPCSSRPSKTGVRWLRGLRRTISLRGGAMTISKMVRHDEPDGPRFTFRLSEEVAEDVKFENKALQAIDPRRFGKSAFPGGSIAYGIETKDPDYTGEALWHPSEGKLLIVTGGDTGALREYQCDCLDAAVVQAYDEGAFE
jgi:tetratricopeptide (TPR) repeat protein